MSHFSARLRLFLRLVGLWITCAGMMCYILFIGRFRAYAFAWKRPYLLSNPGAILSALTWQIKEMSIHAYAWEAVDMIRRKNEKIPCVAFCGRPRAGFWGAGSLPENVAAASS